MAKSGTSKALITGITGQDGSYLAEFLLRIGYEVHGLVRRSSSPNTSRIEHLLDSQGLHLHHGDLSDSSRLVRFLDEVRPTEIYNLAAQSHVMMSFGEPEYTGNTTGLGTVRLLEAVRLLKLDAKYYQASSSEMFGATPPPQNEETPFHPRSPYGVAKVYGHWITRNYRESYGMFATNGILFNHESPRRGEQFVTRKITKAVAEISQGVRDVLHLGNLDARRDWGYAPEYVQGMWLMLQQNKPDDFVLGTATSHSVREFVDAAFSYVGLDWNKYVEFDPTLTRPAEVDDLVGDSAKASTMLGWTPAVTGVELVPIMVDADVAGVGSPGTRVTDTPRFLAGVGL
jgi:GDPmannose 4,6-dehydratase